MKLRGTRYRLMATLMISSQLLLTGFMMYWLTGQYRDAKTELHDRLDQEYTVVRDQLVDSLLMQHLVIPSLNDSIIVKVQRQGSFEPVEWHDSASGGVMVQQHISELPDEIKISALHVDSLAPYDSGVRTIDVTSVITDEEKMVRSVKLFINKNQEAFQGDTGLHLFYMHPDSATILQNMESVVEEHEWPFSLNWPERDLSPAELSRRHGILIGGGPGIYLPTLLVANFTGYLFRSILPQILFGLILLILSASALLFAFRSLQRQLVLNRLRDDFISNISHELKTPVSTVKIALEALRSFDLQKDRKLSGEYLAIASSELERLERLVGRVLHHEMLNNSSLVLDREPCDLGDLARGVVRTLDIPIRKAGARITVPESAEPCSVFADRTYVEGMIMNLLDNSLKYAGENPEIEIRIACDPSGASMSVTDNGPGIADEYRDQVFEKFFRIPSGDKHNVKGYGLGLNFASQVMEQHGGTISFRNLPEGGCRFTLRFPRTTR
jgi:signal transduction histidine kinase